MWGRRGGRPGAAAAEPVVAGGGGTALRRARERFADLSLSDSLRLEAGRRLLGDVPFLVEHYAKRDGARLVRALIEEKVAAGEQSVVPLVLALFESVPGEERIDFEVYLLHFGRRAEKALIALLHAADVNLVMRATDVLAKMKSRAAADSIALLLHHPDSWARIGAAHALGEIGAPGAVGQLEAALADSAYPVVDAALVGLGRLRAVQTYDRVFPLLASHNKHLRKHAAIALGEFGDRRALAALRELAAEDPDPGVRYMAGKALKKLEKQP